MDGRSQQHTTEIANNCGGAKPRDQFNRRSRSKKLHRKQKQQMKAFSQLAGIYLQHLYYLKNSQVEDMLRLKGNKGGEQPQLNSRPSAARQRYFELQDNICREVERRKQEGNFRISAKKHKPLLLYTSKLDHTLMPDPTLEIDRFAETAPDLMAVRSNHTNSPELLRRRRPLAQAQTSVGGTTISDNFFRRNRRENKSLMEPNSHKLFGLADQSFQRSAVVDRKNVCKSANKMSGPTINKSFSFILNSKDAHIRRELEKQGWFENKALSSPIYNLKWCYKEEIDDYRLIESNKQRFYNHIKNNELTNKAGLNRLYKQLSDSGCRPSRFIPRTYEIAEDDELATDYQDTALQIIIKNHVKYFQQKKPKECALIRKLIIRKQRKYIDEEPLAEYLKLPHKVQDRDESFVVNLPMLNEAFMLIVYRVALAEGRQPDKQFAHIMEDAKLLKSILRFSKIHPPYEQYLKITRSNIEQEFSLEKIRQEAKVNKRQMSPNKSSSWWTPTISVMYRTMLYDDYFTRNRPAYKSDGLNNIWIIKPSNCSRGQGIFLTDKLQTILENKQRNKIVQKYVENVWVLTEQKVRETMDSDTLRDSPLFEKKFDLRQWVLVKSVNPLIVYCFSEFYVKICPERYSCGQLHNLSKHLSNYSLNKNSFKDAQDSVMSESDFARLLGCFGIAVEPVKQRIRQQISDIIKVGSQSMEQIDGCFELLGFDILLDEQLNPWVLEVNMSPACTERAEWLTTMLAQMSKKLLRLVLPPSMFPTEDPQLTADRYNWQPILQEQKFEHRTTQLPEILGTRLNVAKQRRRQRHFKPHLQQKIIAVQRRIRQFLSPS